MCLISMFHLQAGQLVLSILRLNVSNFDVSPSSWATDFMHIED